MNLPSASGLERAFYCPASQVLPHFKSRGFGIWSPRGRTIHRYLQRIPEVGLQAALDEVEHEFREACACIEVDRLPPATPEAYAFEVAFAYHLESDTARELCRGKEREEAYLDARPGETTGMEDVITLTDDAAVVLDYKTGYRYFGHLDQNPQLLWYALAAARAYGRRKAHLGIIRINQDGRPYFIWGEVNGEQLDAFAGRLRELDEHISELRLLALAGEPLQTVTGDHCQYCPALPNCPAWMTLMRQMTSPEDDTAGMPPLTPETGALYVDRLKMMRRVVNRVELVLELYAEQAPIELGGGKVFGPYPKPNDEWDVEKAWPVLQHFLQGDAAKVVTAKVVKKEIQEVFRQRKKAGQKVFIEKSTDTVVDALKEAGALRIRFTYPVGEHTPKPELEAGNGGETASAVG